MKGGGGDCLQVYVVGWREYYASLKLRFSLCF
jgi:hypothetical protein